MAKRKSDAVDLDRERVKLRKRHYETIFVLSPKLDDKKKKTVIEKNVQAVSKAEGTILRNDDWGKRKMAYMIQKHAQAFYNYFRYIGTNQTVQSLERSLKLDADVLRFQIISLSDVLSDEAVQDLIQRAPKEPSVPPIPRHDEFDSGADSGSSDSWRSARSG